MRVLQEKLEQISGGSIICRESVHLQLDLLNQISASSKDVPTLIKT